MAATVNQEGSTSMSVELMSHLSLIHSMERPHGSYDYAQSPERRESEDGRNRTWGSHRDQWQPEPQSQGRESDYSSSSQRWHTEQHDQWRRSDASTTQRGDTREYRHRTPDYSQSNPTSSASPPRQRVVETTSAYVHVLESVCDWFVGPFGLARGSVPLHVLMYML